MNIKEKTERIKRKKESKRKRKEVSRKILVVLIGYPIIFPLENLGKWIKRKREDYWFKRLDKLKEKSIEEAIHYIEDGLERYSSFVVYNHFPNDDTDYGNALHTERFFKFAIYHKKKINRYSVLHHKLVWRNAKEDGNIDFSSEEYYKTMYELLQKRIQEKYQDINVDNAGEKIWHRQYECFKVSMDK